jgi:type VI secretion system lysozyme-like protein
MADIGDWQTMARIQHDQELIPSVLDRLIDQEPDRKSEPPKSRSQVLRELKLSVRRDLENLLNTRWRCVAWPPDLKQLELSLVNYGIPDFTGANMGAASDRESLRRIVEEVIRRFEPRFKTVRVEILQNSDEADRTSAVSNRCVAACRARSGARDVQLGTGTRPAAASPCRRICTMTDELLPYYQRELAFLRKSGQEFAEANPKIAARLRLDANLSDDPHVARMIEAFAYLNARTRLKLEDDFPEITEAMLGVLYPHYLNPFPSLAIVQLALDRTQSELVAGQTIPRGTGIESEPSQSEGDPCRFRTCYDTTVWPFEIKGASFKGHPFTVPFPSLGGSGSRRCSNGPADLQFQDGFSADESQVPPLSSRWAVAVHL